jgi:hypothetical protein
MRDGHRGIRLRQVSLGLALLAGLVLGMAACGDDGDPGATPTGTAASFATAQPGLSTTDTPAPPAVGDGPETTPPATTATPGSAATPAATVSVTPTIVVGFDMDSSGNNATALTSTDRCVSVSAESEDEFEVDVFLDGLSMDSVLGFGYGISFPESVVELVSQEHSMLLEAEPGSEVVDLSIDVPTSISPHMVTVADFGPAEYNPPYTQGVLGRYTFKVLPSAEAGTYNLILTDTVIGRDTKMDPKYRDYPVTGAVPTAAIWDGSFEPPYGVIAVDVSCDSAAATAS